MLSHRQRCLLSTHDEQNMIGRAVQSHKHLHVQFVLQHDHKKYILKITCLAIPQQTSPTFYVWEHGNHKTDKLVGHRQYYLFNFDCVCIGVSF